MILIFISILSVVAIMNMTTPPPQEVIIYTYADMVNDLRSGNVRRVEFVRESEVGDSARAQIILHSDDRVHEINIPSAQAFMQLAHQYLDAGQFDFESMPVPRPNWLIQLLPTLLFLGLTAIMLIIIMRHMQAAGGGGGRMMSFGKSKARVTDNKDKITFEEVAGLEEEKTELMEIVDFLKSPRKYMDIGARIPRGVLLVGPPGTGKTYLAKAVAGEADVPFYSISGSDFVEMFVGVGASRVRDLFEQAKRSSASIVFIDEIDAVGRRRGAGLGGGHDEREQTLNQLLVEMDGFGTNSGVIVMAATNRPDILDPALLRPGRFDRRVSVEPPDVKGREAVLEVHARKKKLAPDVDLKKVAQSTPGFTPAFLESLLNEAAILAARANKKAIDNESMRAAYIKVSFGTEKKSRVTSKKNLRIVAYHEAGHAILMQMLSEIDSPNIVSIIPTGRAAGYAASLPNEDRETTLRTKTYLEQLITMSLGGRAAEAIIFKEITVGAVSDIESATSTARDMVVKFGMSDVIGPIQFGNDNNEVFLGRDFAHTRNYGEQAASMIDNEIKRIVEDAYNEALRILTQHLDVMHSVAELLLKKEKITGEEMRACFPYGALDSQNPTDDDFEPAF